MADTLVDHQHSARAAVDAALASRCESALRHVDERVAAAIRYSLLGEGKRFRAQLVVESYRAAGGAADASGLAAAVEIVHAYSLVHDDLPCMDNDDVRRGRPTLHRAFGVAIATAAGVAMVPLAAGMAYEAALALGLDPDRAASIVRELMLASGSAGMIGGQWLDLQAEGREVGLEELERMHVAKTGKLIAASARIGAMAAGAGPEVVRALSGYGEALGLAFQIADDVLDVTSTTDQLGKTAGRDLALHKSTYPRILGVEPARDRARSLSRAACDVLRAAGRLTPGLEQLAVHVVERKS